MIQIKRAYVPPSKNDFWLKEVAPSNDLQKQFAYDVNKYPQFKLKKVWIVK